MICFRCMAVLRPHSFKNMPRNRVQDCGESNNRRNNNKLRMSLEIMMILAFHILKVSILNLCYIYICAESEVRLIFSHFISLPLWQRGVSYSYEKFGWEAGMVSRLCSKKNCREPLGLNLKNPGCMLSIWFLCKNGDFLVSHEEKLATTGHQVLLEYSPGWT